MFPDAPSLRAREHLETLHGLTMPEQLRGELPRNMVLWIIMHGEPEGFIPNLHTDPELCLKIKELAPVLDYRAVSITCNADGWAELRELSVPVMLEPLEDLEKDRGSYMLGLRLTKAVPCTFGPRNIVLEPDWYVYVGSAMGGVKARLSYHQKRFLASRAGRKLSPGHWHVDQLSAAATEFISYPVRSEQPLEDKLAEALSKMDGSREITGFGASDRPGTSHLFGLPCIPHEYGPFREILFKARHRWFLSGR